MRLLRPVSFFLSVCLHAGVIAFALFAPRNTAPLVDLNTPVIDIGIYTIGKPGAAPTPDTPPKASATPPKAPETPSAPPTPIRPSTPPPVPVKPETAPTLPKPEPVPEPDPVPIPQPDEPKREEPLKAKEPPKPEGPKTEPAKATPPAASSKPETPSKPAASAKPQRSAEDILSSALGDLKGKTSDPDSSDPDGDGPGGAGGDGIGLVGSYMQSLVSRIKPNWEYGGRADRRNPTAVVRISIAKDGTILDVAVITSSGDAAFDGSVIKAVRDTIRVEPPPSPDLMRVEVPFAYEAIRR